MLIIIDMPLSLILVRLFELGESAPKEANTTTKANLTILSRYIPVKGFGR
jgi:hypothetical protein